VKCWGWNQYGQLGLGYASQAVSSPTFVPGLDDVASVVLGASHSCAVLVTGLVKCWGSNDSHQLGLYTSDIVYSPMTVTGLTDVYSVILGANHSCALLVSGAVKCWGFNGDGQLGLGFKSDFVCPATLVSGVVLAHTPAAPNITSIVPSAGALTFTGTAPNNGGSKITDYQYTLDGGTTWLTANPRVTSSPYKLAGLANGTTYRVQVRAVNAVGVGAATAVVVVSMPRG